MKNSSLDVTSDSNDTASGVVRLDSGQEPLLGRKQACARLGVSEKTFIRKYEALLPLAGKGPRGAHLYSVTQIDTLIRRPGDVDEETARTVFRRLNEGASQVDLVCDGVAHPDAIERLYGQWMRMRGMMVVSGEELASLAESFGIPRPKSGGEVIDLIARLAVAADSRPRPSPAPLRRSPPRVSKPSPASRTRRPHVGDEAFDVREELLRQEQELAERQAKEEQAHAQRLAREDRADDADARRRAAKAGRAPVDHDDAD